MSSVLVFGGTGMLGHTPRQACRGRVQTSVPVRAGSALSAGVATEYATQVVTGVRAEASETVEQRLDTVQLARA